MIPMLLLLIFVSGMLVLTRLQNRHDERIAQLRLKYKTEKDTLDQERQKIAQESQKIEQGFQKEMRALDRELVETRLEFTHFPVYMLMRQDDNGNRSVVKCFFDKEEAEKVLDEYNELSHKQLYWLKVDRKIEQKKEDIEESS